MTHTHPITAKKPSTTTAAAEVEGLSSEPVQAFCQQHQLLDELREVMHIAGECFNAASIKVSVQGDPETGDEWIEVAVDAAGTVQQVMEAEHRYTLRLREEVPARMRDRLRLYLTSIDD